MRLCTPAEAAALVKDGSTVLVDGSGGGVNEPTAVLRALEERYLSEGDPKDLTVVHVSGMGDGHGGGIDRFAHRGMVRRVIGGHWGWTPGMQQMARDNLIEGYCLPQGTLSHLLRDIAAGRPGSLSAVGLGTFIDPRLGGGRLNTAAAAEVVRLVELDGRTWLFTPAFPIDVAVIRGTEADADGNITMDGEGLLAETLSAAQAARNSGGIVIAQVRHLVAAGSLDPRRVRVPAVLVDALVVDAGQRLSFATADDPFLTGARRKPATAPESMALSVRKVIARRAAMALRRGDVINLGFGMPDGVGAILAEEGRAHEVTFTVEQGHIGGVPAGGSDFGLCVNPQASLDAGHQFDWYDGGGLDVAVLSFAQVDAAGNVNVSRFGDHITGVGGFIDIAQGAKRLVFVGTLTAGGRYRIGDGPPIAIIEEGQPKFVAEVDQISFSAARAREVGQPVIYVTERAVFRLGTDGPELVEVAAGLQVERDVVEHMGFKPPAGTDLAQIDPRCFQPGLMGLVLGDPIGAVR